jgi:hypothetical protein
LEAGAAVVAVAEGAAPPPDAHLDVEGVVKTPDVAGISNEGSGEAKGPSREALSGELVDEEQSEAEFCAGSAEGEECLPVGKVECPTAGREESMALSVPEAGVEDGDEGAGVGELT